jgi:hypothetical protein
MNAVQMRASKKSRTRETRTQMAAMLPSLSSMGNWTLRKLEAATNRREGKAVSE